MKKFIVLTIACLAIIGVYLYMRPVPAIGPISQISVVPKTQAIALPWPSAGQAAIGASGYGVLASNNTSKPVPIASIAKIITAIAVLKQKSIAPGSQGATITLDSTDVDYYNNYALKNGSVTKVAAGEQLTEVQALQALLIPSSNNMADTLARWAFGSADAYVSYSNQMVKAMGLANTTVGDANGFGDNTLSTADDLVKLGIAALNNPAISQVVSQSSTQVPVAGTINNVNWLLGTDGVVGIKTGNTDQAGGCYLFASHRIVSGHKITLVGAILAQPDLNQAINAAKPLIDGSDSGFEQITIVHKGQTLGNYTAPWGATAQIKSAKDLPLLVWKGKDIKILNEHDTISAPVKAGTSTGTVTVQSSQQTTSSALVLSQPLHKAPLTWRLWR